MRRLKYDGPASFRQMSVLARVGVPLDLVRQMSWSAAYRAIKALAKAGWKPTAKWVAKWIGVAVDDVRFANVGRGETTCAA